MELSDLVQSLAALAEALKDIGELETRIVELETKIEDHEHEASDITDLEDFVDDKVNNGVDEAVNSLTIVRG